MPLPFYFHLGTRLIDVCDREADFFEMFDEQRRHDRVDLLVRSKYNRTIAKAPFKLFDAVRGSKPWSEVRVHIPRQSARPKKNKQKARPKKPGHTAILTVRCMRAQLPVPKYLEGMEPVDIWIVHALEENPPENTKAIEWFLMTPIDIRSSEDAERCLRYYCLRPAISCSGMAIASFSLCALGSHYLRRNEYVQNALAGKGQG